MIIKKYNQFVETKFNESTDLSEDTINRNKELASDEDFEIKINRDSDSIDGVDKNKYKEINNVTEEEMEEEGGEYIGQKMIRDLADKLGVKPNSDGSVTYNGKKINFYSETEKFHVDNKKFSSVDEVINYLNDDVESTVKSENIRKIELEEDENKIETQSKLESKSYKFTRKFNKYR